MQKAKSPSRKILIESAIKVTKILCNSCIPLWVRVFIFVPLIEVLCIVLPLTPGAIGIREGLMVIMFEQLGLSNADAGIYVLIAIIPTLLKLIGILPVLHGLMKNKAIKINKS